MHGPDGTDYRATFTPDGDKTHLEWHMLFDTAEESRRTVEVFKADEGLKQNVVRLEAYLAGV